MTLGRKRALGAQVAYRIYLFLLKIIENIREGAMDFRSSSLKLWSLMGQQSEFRHVAWCVSTRIVITQLRCIKNIKLQ